MYVSDQWNCRASRDRAAGAACGNTRADRRCRVRQENQESGRQEGEETLAAWRGTSERQQGIPGGASSDARRCRSQPRNGGGPPGQIHASYPYAAAWHPEAGPAARQTAAAGPRRRRGPPRRHAVGSRAAIAGQGCRYAEWQQMERARRRVPEGFSACSRTRFFARSWCR